MATSENEGPLIGQARRRSASLSQHTHSGGSSRKASSPKLPSDIPEVADDMARGFKETDSLARSSSDWEMDDMESDEGLEDDEETGLTQQERLKRKKRKRRHTLVDERIAQDDQIISKEEKRMANASFYRASLINAVLIGMWYTFSISISVVRRQFAFYGRSGLAILTSVGSTTNGCSPKGISTFIFLCSRHACTWWCSSSLRLRFCISSHRFGPSTR